MKKIILCTSLLFPILSMTQISFTYANESISDEKTSELEATMSKENNYPLFEEISSIEAVSDIKQKNKEILSIESKTFSEKKVPIFESNEINHEKSFANSLEHSSDKNIESTSLDNKKNETTNNNTSKKSLPLAGIKSINTIKFGILLLMSVLLINKLFKKSMNNEEK